MMCRGEYPHLKNIDEKYRDRGLQVISISQDGSPQEAAMLPREVGARFPVVLDSTGKISGDYDVEWLPHNVLIGKSGRIEQIVELGGLEAAARQAIESESN